MYQSCWNARSWYGVAAVLAWTTGSSKSSAGHQPGRYWLVHHCNHWEKKKEGEEKRAAKNGRGDGAIAGTEEKIGDSIMSPTKDRHLIAQLTSSLVPPSLPPFPCHLTLLPWDCACWERSLQNSRAHTGPGVFCVWAGPWMRHWEVAGLTP